MILLDTHVLIWLRSGDGRLGPGARKVIDQAWRDGEAAVSAISFWEAAMLKQRNRIELAADVSQWRREQLRQGLAELPVDGDVGVRAALLGDFRDPADRLIVATALEGHRLLTADRRILDWPGELSRMDASS